MRDDNEGTVVVNDKIRDEKKKMVKMKLAGIGEDQMVIPE